MLIHLIRHAHAGSRKHWHGDDRLRPLSHRGERQAAAVADELADAGIDQLWSSVFVRCVQTLEPIAHRRGLEIEARDDLTEGGSGAKALDALLAAADAGHVVAASSHGDVIPAIVDEAVRRGAKLHGTDSPRKAARYEITVVDGTATHLRHVEAPDGRS
ncbi:MAG: hypothetical protein JWM47_2823 [Acidimicrobiales bacterium]|nr:hypothetical protein [Acidimicrobiales bacterium]